MTHSDRCHSVELLKWYAPVISIRRAWKFNDFIQAGIITFKTSIIKGGVEKFALKQPIFLVLQISLPITCCRSNLCATLAFSSRPALFRKSEAQSMPDRLSLTLVQLVFEGISVDYREPPCSSV